MAFLFAFRSSPGALSEGDDPPRDRRRCPRPRDGPACLTLHGHPERFTGQENHTLIGTFETANGSPPVPCGASVGRLESRGQPGKHGDVVPRCSTDSRPAARRRGASARSTGSEGALRLTEVRTCKVRMQAARTSGRLGVWWSGSWRAEAASLDTAGVASGAREPSATERIWSSGGFEPGLSKHFERLLRQPTRIVVASGIVTVWHSAPEEVAAAVADLDDRYPGRFLLGLGASHAAIVENYARPVQSDGPLISTGSMRPRTASRQNAASWRRSGRGCSSSPRIGPQGRTRTSSLRSTPRGPVPSSGPDGFLHQRSRWCSKAIRPGPAKSRVPSPPVISVCRITPRNLLSIGYDEGDLAGGGSDRLVDAVVCWGDTETVATKVQRALRGGCRPCLHPGPLRFRGSFPLARVPRARGRDPAPVSVSALRCSTRRWHRGFVEAVAPASRCPVSDQPLILPECELRRGRAVDDDGLAAHVARQLRRQEHHDLGDLVGLTHSSERSAAALDPGRIVSS